MSERRCQIYWEAACFSLWLLSVFSEMWKYVLFPANGFPAFFPIFFANLYPLIDLVGSLTKLGSCMLFFLLATRGYFSLMNLLPPDSPSVVSKEKWLPSGGRRTWFGFCELVKSFSSCWQWTEPRESCPLGKRWLFSLICSTYWLGILLPYDFLPSNLGALNHSLEATISWPTQKI